MPKPSSIAGLDARTPLRRAAQELLAARLADLRSLEEGAATLNPDSIHDLRVATRRLRAGLQIFCDGSDEAVRALGKALGEVRDRQVELEWLATRVSNRVERARVGRSLRDELGQASRQLQAALRRWSTRDIAEVLRALGSARTSGRLGGGWGASRLKGGLSALKPKLKGLRKVITPDETHALRKKVKRLKYEAELFDAAHPRAVKQWTAALSSLQRRLGDRHDADLRCTWLDHNPAASPALRDVARRERAELTLRLARELERWQRENRLRKLRRSLWD